MWFAGSSPGHGCQMRRTQDRPPSGLGDADSLGDEVEPSLEGGGVDVFILGVGRSVEVLFQLLGH